MLEVTIKHIGAVQFEISARNHRIYSDQPIENGGFDEGMTPPELMLASLGACAAYYAVDYLKALTSPGGRGPRAHYSSKGTGPASAGRYLYRTGVPGDCRGAS